MSSDDENRPVSPSILQTTKKRKFSVSERKVSKGTQVTYEDLETAKYYQRCTWDQNELKTDVSNLPQITFEDEPKDPRNRAFAALIAHEMEKVPSEKRSVTYVNIINLIRKVRKQKDLDDISLPSYQDSD